MSDIKSMEIKEFVEKGFLQEVNRKFFHPLGLALAVKDNEDGTWSLHEVWDYRDDPEGMFFGDGVISEEKIETVENLRKSKVQTRLNTKDVTVDENGIQKI
jgi:hypothetical protein